MGDAYLAERVLYLLQWNLLLEVQLELVPHKVLTMRLLEHSVLFAKHIEVAVFDLIKGP